jgi:hypothetical protein
MALKNCSSSQGSRRLFVCPDSLPEHRALGSARHRRGANQDIDEPIADFAARRRHRLAEVARLARLATPLLSNPSLSPDPGSVG